MYAVDAGPEELAEPVEGGWGPKKKEQKAEPPPVPKSTMAKMAPKEREIVQLKHQDVSWGFGDDAEEVDSGDEVLFCLSSSIPSASIHRVAHTDFNQCSPIYVCMYVCLCARIPYVFVCAHTYENTNTCIFI
jgi:hypothetical protein